jgi:hypothetical protein
MRISIASIASIVMVLSVGHGTDGIRQNVRTGSIAWFTMAMGLGLGHRPDLVKIDTHGPCYFLHRWAQRAACTKDSTPDPRLDLDLEVPLPPTPTPPPSPTFNLSSALCTADGGDSGNKSQSRVRNNFSKLEFFIDTVL